LGTRMGRYASLIELLAPWKFAVNIAAAACALCAAACWLRASLAKMPKELRHLFHLSLEGPFWGDLADLPKGVLKQSQWNAHAAGAAAILTGISALIGIRWG
jgi:hypothetical protein